MYTPVLTNIVELACGQLQVKAQNAGSVIGTHITQWMKAVSGTNQIEKAFMSPGSFPMLLLPWLAELTLQAEPDINFQADLVYSTVSGYYYIRLVDNVMDGHENGELHLLPMLNFFHSQFQSPYQRYFNHNHPFWDYFHQIWLHSAEVTLQDSMLDDIDLEDFMKISAQKTCAAKIPVAAVFLHYRKPDRFDNWDQFVNLFGCWHQMWNDIYDWIRDTRLETHTYFLSEGNHRKQAGEPLVDWVIREGFDWGMNKLDEWMSQLKELVFLLGGSQLGEYLQERDRLFSLQRVVMIENLQETGKLLAGIKKALDINDDGL